MPTSEDLIDFEVIETQKENIQSLPGGRSARALAAIYSPLPLSKSSSPPPPSHTQNLNDAVRAEYEKEIIAIADSDDPLDVYDRYVRWTLDAYPSAQATPQSQLLPLLERATKAFLSAPHYKNDPRYLKLWLHYIRLFADAPRETFAFLARHGIGDGLALFYEEFAAWLETAGRWKQADEVYALGLEREARPAERLLRKYGEFQHRFEARPLAADEPSSPALPTVRPALAAKVDPFAPAAGAGPVDPQARSRGLGGAGAGASSRQGRQKLAIFADGDEQPKGGLAGGAKGWESIGSLAERKKENTVEARPWAGETLKAGKTNAGVPKMMIFKDESVAEQSLERNASSQRYQSVNPKTGRPERVFVNLEAVYPNGEDSSAEEFCFEELRAKHRGWLHYDWRKEKSEKITPGRLEVCSHQEVHHVVETTVPLKPGGAAALLAQELQESLVLNDENRPPSQDDGRKIDTAKKIRKEERANRTRKIRVMEVRGATQTVQTNLASPTGPKIKRKKSPEQTMTLYTKEAMDEIYGIFNQPLKSSDAKDGDGEGGESDDDDDYTSAGESTATGQISGTTSEFEDETAADLTEAKSSIGDADDTHHSDTESVSAWSDFTVSKHVPNLNQDTTHEETTDEPTEQSVKADHGLIEEELITPVSEEPQAASASSRFIPIPPEGCEAPTRPYRDQAQAAQSRLPFMTPIVEKTESSIGAATAVAEKDYFDSKTPCRQNTAVTSGVPELVDEEPWSSPFHDVTVEDPIPDVKVRQPALPKANKSRAPLGEIAQPVSQEIVAVKKNGVKGPIIKDAQCNPMDEQTRKTILDQIHPPLSSYEGYFERKDVDYGKTAEFRKFAKALSKVGKNSNEKTATSLAVPPELQLQGTDRAYTIKRELGKGAFAPVYLVESKPKQDSQHEDTEEVPARMGKGKFGIARNALEAVKMEDPPSAWEFYILRQAHRRLGVSRAAESIIQAYEMHLFRDECFLVEEYRDQGTLLDIVNAARADIASGSTGVMDEQLAMFFTVELLRTVEAMHAKGLIHGDLKADNVLVRLEPLTDGQWSSQYHRDGSDGWAAKGVTLIDFGRGIDMRAFVPDVRFVADWVAGDSDCAEMREMRPWTFQVDYHGLAGIVHSLLFGKYMETVAERGGGLGAGATKTYRVREPLKRYWQTETWAELLDLLLNPLMHLEGEEGSKLPVLKGMRKCRERMEEWLEANCEKGVGLKALVRRVEHGVKDRKR